MECGARERGVGNKVISDLDIYRAANILMDRYGHDAPLFAIKRATKMLDAGDLNGYAVWKRILRAVEEMQRTGQCQINWA